MRASAIRVMPSTWPRKANCCYAVFDERIFRIASEEEEFVEPQITVA